MNKKSILLLAMGLSLAGGAGWYYVRKPLQQEKQAAVGIKDYLPDRDREFILDQFKENWYWLISSPDYDIKYALDNRAPNKYEPQLKGKMKIRVLYADGKPAGFSSFYMRNAVQGDILFIEVDKRFRGKGYAVQLVNDVFAELKKMGAKIAKWVTRPGNKKSRGLYEGKLKVPIVNVDDKYVYYRKEL